MTIFGNVGFMGFPIIFTIWRRSASVCFAVPASVQHTDIHIWYGKCAKAAVKRSGAVKKSGRESIEQIFNIGVIFV